MDKAKIALKILIVLLLTLRHAADAQSIPQLNIDSCQVMARRNYPLVKQLSLIKLSKNYTLSNAAKRYLPQLNIAGQATYQSDVTQLPIELANVNIPMLDKDQYRIYGEVTQPLTDLFTIKDDRNFVKTNAAIEEEKIEVELYKLKERINQLYFGILLTDEQIRQAELLENDFETSISKTSAGIAYGTALKSNLNILKAELLTVKQRSIELKATRKGFTDVLGIFIQQNIDENTKLQKPKVVSTSSIINRPELRLYDTQRQIFDIQSNLANEKMLPNFSLFFQGGYGRPALNMLSNDFDLYYIGGLRLNWKLTSFYTFNKEKKILALNQYSLDVQKETFLFNTNIILQQQTNEISKLKELIDTDKEIIALHENIRSTAKMQMEHGAATLNDYLKEVNAEDKAKQDMLLHQTQLLMTQYKYQTTAGN